MSKKRGDNITKCPQCQHENREGARFCVECGAKLENLCHKCGAMLPPGARFCDECGTRIVEAESTPAIITVPKLEDAYTHLQRVMPGSLAEKLQPASPDMEGENRIISILFGDISNSVGITENMAPEDAADLINKCVNVMVDVILKYEGSINRYVGDCVLAFFGTPTVHENDPERAILAALEMREAVGKLNLSIKIGINTGMVYVGSMGPEAHREFAAMGTAVNLASRLQQSATEPGQILAGESTYRHTRRSFEFKPLPVMTVKGISEPVRAYEVLKALPRPEKIRGIEGLKAEMIGRDRELADLKESADELLKGRGQIVTITGEAGVGKTRLVSELKDYIRDKDVRWLEGRCVSIGESTGYWVFIDILRSCLGFSDSDTSESLRERIISSMQKLFPHQWEDIIPYIGNLLSVKLGSQWDDRISYMPPEQLKYQTFLTLRSIFLAMAQQKPLLLIFEDLHWADNLSLDLINLLMNDLILAPLMLLCVHRPEKEHRSWHISSQASGKCLDRYREIALRALNPQDSRRLVGALLDIENLPDSVRENIIRKSDGNPFFVEEVIRSLIEGGAVYRDGDRWVAKAEVEGIAVPDTIQSVIMARIDRLEEEVKYVLQSASVIGRLFRHRLLQYTTQQEQNLDGYLWKLEDRELVYEERAIPELEYSFRHALTQETAYNTILSRRRREFHHKVAEGYEALYSNRLEEYYEDLAYHYSRSDDRKKALYYLVKAGDKSRETFANEEAIRYYNQALKLIGDVNAASTIGHIYQSLGEIYFPMTRHEEALECLSKALEHTTDKKRRARIYGTMGWIYQREDRDDLALEHLNAGIAELGDDTESPEMAMICVPLYWVKKRRKDVEEAGKIALRGLKIVEGTERYFEIVDLYDCVTDYFADLCHDIDKALEYARREMEIAQRSGNSYLISDSTFRLGWVHFTNGENDLAIKFMRESLEICGKIGYTFGIAIDYYFLSLIYYRREDWDTAIECYERIPIHPSAFGGLLENANCFAWVYLQKGNAQKAIETCKMAMEFIERLGTDSIVKDLAVLEEAHLIMDKRGEFTSYCKKVREEKREAIKDLKLTQWYLEPAKLSGLFTQAAFMYDFDSPDLKPEWKWTSPKADSSYSLSIEGGWLEVRVASGSNLLQTISRDFAAEVKLKAASSELPSVGGLLVWKDKKNHIRFEKGMHLEDEIGLSGSVQGKYDYFGRGILASDVVYLRLERIGHIFSAYCSSDGVNWMTCGQVSFPAEDPIQIGIHAIGTAEMGGGYYKASETATRFDYFRVLRRASKYHEDLA